MCIYQYPRPVTAVRFQSNVFRTDSYEHLQIFIMGVLSPLHHRTWLGEHISNDGKYAFLSFLEDNQQCWLLLWRKLLDVGNSNGPDQRLLFDRTIRWRRGVWCL